MFWSFISPKGLKNDHIPLVWRYDIPYILYPVWASPLYMMITLSENKTFHFLCSGKIPSNRTDEHVLCIMCKWHGSRDVDIILFLSESVHIYCMSQQSLTGLQWNLFQISMTPEHDIRVIRWFVAPLAAQSFVLSSEISQHMLDGLAQKFVHSCFADKAMFVTLVSPPRGKAFIVFVRPQTYTSLFEWVKSIKKTPQGPSSWEYFCS